jgi:hypothetical protein
VVALMYAWGATTRVARTDVWVGATTRVARTDA